MTIEPDQVEIAKRRLVAKAKRREKDAASAAALAARRLRSGAISRTDTLAKAKQRIQKREVLKGESK
jgi:hypothetical protein